jgi:multidrug efflux system outer membrane protein
MKNNINWYIFLLPVLLILNACKVSKDIATPQPELPTQFRSETTTDTASVADLQWKDYFTDTTLQRLIDSAVANNYDMQVAVKNIESAQLLYKQTKWAYFPNVNFQLSANSNRPSDNSLNGLSASQFLGTSHIEDFTASVGLSWEADIWGKIKNQNARVLAAYLQTSEAKKAVQTSIVASVAQGYYNLLMLDEQLSIAKKNVALNDSTLFIMKLQFNAGQTSLLGIQQAEAQRLVAAQLVPEIEQNITLQENALRVLSANLPDRIARTARLNDITFKSNPAAGIPSAIVSRRPDVRSRELDLNIANANVGITKANMYPTLSITAAGGINSFKASNWFNIPASLFGAVAGSLTQPIFQKKQLTTQYEVAKVEREKTVIRFRQSVLTAVGEVSDALVKIEKLQEQETISATRVSTLQQAIGNAGQLYRNGMANYLEVITAQANVLQSELQLSAIKRAQLTANVELYKSLGGGWK